MSIQEGTADESCQESIAGDDVNADAKWLLQLENVLFSSAPSEENKAAGKRLCHD